MMEEAEAQKENKEAIERALKKARLDAIQADEIQKLSYYVPKGRSFIYLRLLGGLILALSVFAHIFIVPAILVYSTLEFLTIYFRHRQGKNTRLFSWLMWFCGGQAAYLFAMITGRMFFAHIFVAYAQFWTIWRFWIFLKKTFPVYMYKKYQFSHWTPWKETLVVDDLRPMVSKCTKQEYQSLRATFSVETLMPRRFWHFELYHRRIEQINVCVETFAHMNIPAIYDLNTTREDAQLRIQNYLRQNQKPIALNRYEVQDSVHAHTQALCEARWCHTKFACRHLNA